MDTELQLLHEKIIRIGKSADDARLAFLTTVLTCGGLCLLEYGQPRGFGDFRRVFGDAPFLEIRRHLKDEGVLVETGAGLHLNLPGYADLSYDERAKIAQRLGATLFESGEGYFMNVLGKVLSTPEGEYVLSELAKVGPFMAEDSVSHISQAIGTKYFRTVREQLAPKGIFVLEDSSQQHEYYCLFPPVVQFMQLDLPSRRQALTFVYVAQGIRDEAGVLKSDCTHIQGEIRPLIVRGAIREVHWYDLEGYKTTPRGTLLSHEIMKERMEGARERVNRLLDHLPATCVRYILERLVFSKDWEGRHERAANGYFRHGADGTLCLLDDPRLKTSRDEVFNKLVDLGLAEEASGYVSTGRGSTHEPVFVFSPEVKEHLAAYLQRQQSSGPILPDAM
ncbi:MAG: hypothetical protein NTU41_12105, partial [Chloroflexi bacterium]|nr:hypothetical protein [Chloroflexota bacterium]